MYLRYIFSPIIQVLSQCLSYNYLVFISYIKHGGSENKCILGGLELEIANWTNM